MLVSNKKSLVNQNHDQLAIVNNTILIQFKEKLAVYEIVFLSI